MPDCETCTAAPSARETNLLKWNCHIPGKENTLWEGGFYPLTMEFSEEYPARPPKVCVGKCILGEFMISKRRSNCKPLKHQFALFSMPRAVQIPRRVLSPQYLS